MKIPQTPPDLSTYLANLPASDLYERLPHIFNTSLGPYDHKGRYQSWDKLRHLTPPKGFTIEEYWFALKGARKAIAKKLPFQDKVSQPFKYSMPDGVVRDLLSIEKNSTGAIETDGKVTDEKNKQTYLISSLIEEAITSSQLEGASTSRRQAKDLLKTGREPKDHSEKMILNNHRAMQFIREYKDEKLSPSMIFELHRILTEGTLTPEDIDKAGAFRDAEDDICVFSKGESTEPLHIPPKANELSKRLHVLCEFANQEYSNDDKDYIPSVIRAIIIHFMIGYDHPFVDGNGRTARALFYWMMAKEKYWLMEYISISRVIKKSPKKYMQAYLHTETDDNDLTYFIIHQLDVIREAISDLHTYLTFKSQQLRETASLLRNTEIQSELNHRQLSLLQHALRNPGMEYTVKSHQGSHGVTQQTARTDLLTLSNKLGLLRRLKVGNKDVFIVPADIEDKLRNLS
ncbi:MULTISPECIES: Fic family protein [Thalassolituus]|jgi:Fic family protein|uniref:Fido domain-containing protein n=1 Tax=Thalassolituus oleivorans MIL-1 TaxID=1298593 RepID=M5DV14_9GAMM|nr:Fic family protein [Thalassolituus oleivorans]CCU73727.1 hypothetical protein TOL_3337 [Thalassolituus oleivorans MIL-1]